MELVTVFSSTLAMDCYIVKGRLERDDVDVFIFDEHIVNVHPFWALAVGGVKLKVPVDQVDIATEALKAVKQGKFVENTKASDFIQHFEKEYEWRNEILEITSRIRKDPTLLSNPSSIKSEIIGSSGIKELIETEKKFLQLQKRKLNFEWKQFWYELFDFSRDVFKYLRPIPVDYYLDIDIVDKYINQTKSQTKSHVLCPGCNSDNVSFGYAFDIKWDILYLALSLLSTPFPPIRMKHHCFECGLHFK